MGRIAKAMQLVAIAAIQNHHGARPLRRTLNLEVAAATHRATNQLGRAASDELLVFLIRDDDLAGDHCPTGAALLSLAEKCPLQARFGSIRAPKRLG